MIVAVLLMGCMRDRVHAIAQMDAELSERIQKGPVDMDLEVIVRLRRRPAVSLSSAEKQFRPRLIRQLKADARRDREELNSFFATNSYTEKINLWIINGFTITARADTIKKLSQLPVVYSITPNRTFQLSKPGYASGAMPSWNMYQINAHILWSFGFQGSNTTVAIMDSGADVMNPHLSASFRGGSNSWFDATGIYSSPHDSDGHGTQVLGIILGAHEIDMPMGGAPCATWIAARIFDQQGQADANNAHRAFQWLLDPDGNPDTDDAPDVVNCSWGLASGVNECIIEFQDDVSLLRQAGIAVVFSAGNENVNPQYPSSISPANYPESLSVGAVDSVSSVFSSSSRGPSACNGSIYPTLTAPGAFIQTCDLSYGGLFDEHVYVSGTSFAAPHVTAAFALLMQAFDDADHCEIEQALIASAVDLGDAGADSTYGNGLIDIYAAYRHLALSYPAADLNHDHEVNYDDLELFGQDWLNTDCPCRADMNNDHKVDLADFSIFAGIYLSRNGPQ